MDKNKPTFISVFWDTFHPKNERLKRLTKASMRF